MTGKGPSPLTISDVAEPTPAEAAAEQLRQWILSGRLPLGKRIPSERDLAERLGVTRNAMRNALLRLEEEGLLEGAVGRGRTVAKQPEVAEGVDTLMSGTIAIVVDEGFVKQNHMTMRPSGWASATPAGAVGATFAKGFSVLLVPEGQASQPQLPHLYSSPPQGLVMINELQGLHSRDEVLAAFRLKQIPVVAYGDVCEWPGCDIICSDHRQGCRDLTHWLIGEGCRRILRLGNKESSDFHWVRERYAGHEEACQAAGVTVMPPLQAPEEEKYDGSAERFEASAHLLAGYLFKYINGDDPVDAVMTLSDGFVPKVAAALRILGRDPESVKVVGYDNYWQDSPDRRHDAFAPHATVDKKNFGIGEALVDLLVDRLSGGLGPEPVLRTVAQELVVVAREGQ